MVKKLIVIIIFACSIISCFRIKDDNDNRKYINALLKSKKACDIIQANFLIGELRDSLYIDTLFKDIYNRQVCPGHPNFKGFSIYQSKIGALRKIACIDSAFKVTNKPDSAIVNFMRQKYITLKLIKN